MNQQPSFRINTEDTTKDYGKFVIEPLEQGYGQTLGSGLRRVLLSSLPGAAVTQVTVSGLKHQFGTVKGVKEDGVDLLLNIKKLRVAYNGDKPATLKLQASGEGIVTAAQIKTPADVEIANPEQVIATISDKKSKLDIEMIIEPGVGYSLANERKTNKIGQVAVDADFSPIKRVNYKVEETRVGRLTNFDKLTLEIWTDGTIDPSAAIKQSGEILVSYLARVVNPVAGETADGVVKTTTTSGSREDSLSVEELGLPTRIANALSKAGFETVADLKNRREDLNKVRNMGDKSIKIIQTALKEKGIVWEA